MTLAEAWSPSAQKPDDLMELIKPAEPDRRPRRMSRRVRQTLIGITVLAIIAVGFVFWPSKEKATPPTTASKEPVAGTVTIPAPPVAATPVALVPNDAKPSSLLRTVTLQDANPLDTSPARCYQWKVGDVYVYDFEMTADPPGIHQSIKGSCQYTVAAVEIADAGDPSKEDEPDGTGTAFVVTADGYLVTCAHVVRDAVQVTVKLGENSWPARVMAFDPIKDLAVLKIEANDLPALPLSPDPAVELAQSVRVIGYPLTDMLGKGIKITSGSVAGTTDADPSGARQFQIDATVNPGNSGGPLVDDRGQVVGVTSALLSGFKISEVGFAVPVDEVRALLEHIQVKPTGQVDTNALTGPEIARQVIPAVALVEVKTSEEANRSYRVRYSYRIDDKPTDADIRDRESGSFVVDRCGEVSDYQGSAVLPHTFDPIGRLFVENLSADGERSWESHQFTSFTERIPKTGGIGGFFGGRPAREVVPETRSYSAIEQRTYEITSENASHLTISKKYEYKTIEDTKPARLSQRGEGSFEFDLKLHMVSSSIYEGTSSERTSSNSLATVPYKLTYTLRDSNAGPLDKTPRSFADLAYEFGRQVAQDSERQARGPNPGDSDARTAPEHRPVNPQQNVYRLEQTVPQHVQANGNSSVPLSEESASVLANMPFDPSQQPWISSRLIEFVYNGNVQEKIVAARGLKRWVGKEHVPQLIELLTAEIEHVDWPEHREIMLALSRFRTRTVMRALAGQLQNQPEWMTAEGILRDFGPRAEEEVAFILKVSSPDARARAADLLREIGTERSLNAVSAALKVEQDAKVKAALESAVEAIEGGRPNSRPLSPGPIFR